jgi:hypothetical protein
VTDVEVGQFEVTVRAENPTTTERFLIVINADESVTFTKLPSR